MFFLSYSRKKKKKNSKKLSPNKNFKKNKNKSQIPKTSNSKKKWYPTTSHALQGQKTLQFLWQKKFHKVKDNVGELLTYMVQIF